MMRFCSHSSIVLVIGVLVLGLSSPLAQSFDVPAHTSHPVGLVRAPLLQATPQDVARLYLPQVMAGRVIQGRLVHAGAPLANATVSLWLQTGSNWVSLITTPTNAAGQYAFTQVLPLGPGRRYQVRYANSPVAASRWFGNWIAPEITAFPVDGAVDLGTMDVTDVQLTSPASGASIRLPMTFGWAPRAASPDDSYQFLLFRQLDGDPILITDPALGYVGNYVLNALPAGYGPGQIYYWGVGVRRPDVTYGGVPFLRFFGVLSLAGLPMLDPTAGWGDH